MATEQYHEPAGELSQEIIEEAEAINWYAQRISVEKDPNAKAIIQNAKKKNSNILVYTLNFY